MAEIEKAVTIYVAGIEMTIDVRGTEEMTEEDWTQKAYSIIKSRLLSQWNAYCE